MLFRNNDPEALRALEMVRTGNYGEDYEDEFWGECEDDTAFFYDEDDLADRDCDEYRSEVDW